MSREKTKSFSGGGSGRSTAQRQGRKAHGHVRRPLLSSRKKVVLSLLAVAVAAGLFVGFQSAMSNWDRIMAASQEFIARQIDARVKTVMVSGAVHAAPAELKKALDLKRGDSLVGFDARTAREKLEDLAWVESAGVVRTLPSTVKIDIREHEPLARLEHQGSVWIMARDGHLVTKNYDGFEHLPVLRGKGAKENAADLLALVAQYPQMAEKVISGVYVGECRWDVEFANGAIVKLPEQDPALALDYLQVLHQERDLLNVDGVMVDLRLPDRIVLRLPEGTHKDYM